MQNDLSSDESALELRRPRAHSPHDNDDRVHTRSHCEYPATHRPACCVLSGVHTRTFLMNFSCNLNTVLLLKLLPLPALRSRAAKLKESHVSSHSTSAASTRRPMVAAPTSGTRPGTLATRGSVSRSRVGSCTVEHSTGRRTHQTDVLSLFSCAAHVKGRLSQQIMDYGGCVKGSVVEGSAEGT